MNVILTSGVITTLSKNLFYSILVMKLWTISVYC